jgi:hypothetical protein
VKRKADTAKAYNANNGLSLEDIAERNSIIKTGMKMSRVHTIPPNIIQVFNCNN